MSTPILSTTTIRPIIQTSTHESIHKKPTHASKVTAQTVEQHPIVPHPQLNPYQIVPSNAVDQHFAPPPEQVAPVDDPAQNTYAYRTPNAR